MVSREHASIDLYNMHKTICETVNLDGIFCMREVVSDDFYRSFEMYQERHRDEDKLLYVFLNIDEDYFTASIKRGDLIIFSEGGKIYNEYDYYFDYIDSLCDRIKELLLEYPLEDLPQDDIDTIREDIKSDTQWYADRIAEEQKQRTVKIKAAQEKTHQEMLAYMRTLPWYQQVLLFLQGKMR